MQTQFGAFLCPLGFSISISQLYIIICSLDKHLNSPVLSSPLVSLKGCLSQLWTWGLVSEWLARFIFPGDWSWYILSRQTPCNKGINAWGGIICIREVNPINKTHLFCYQRTRLVLAYPSETASLTFPSAVHTGLHSLTSSQSTPNQPWDSTLRGFDLCQTLGMRRPLSVVLRRPSQSNRLWARASCLLLGA